MAYGLKYSQYISKGGAEVQIRVYVKDWAGASYGMAHLTGAALQIVGGTSDVLTPVIKTALSWSMADCWDEGSTQADGTECVNAQGEKCGRWEEFYTNDATKFRVEVWAKATPSATAACIWKGFVTPDSWSENMIYRGSVTITARDMLGALQDKEFNLTGRVSVLDVVTGALAACECPMSLNYTAAHFLQNSNGQSILAHTFAASVFAGDTWQKALADTLESLGLVLRYNGAGSIALTSLRYLPADMTAGTHTIEFVNRSGLRELSPALKEITEVFDVDFVSIDADDPEASAFADSGTTMTQRQKWTGALVPTDVAVEKYDLTAPLTGGWLGNLGVPRPTTIGAGVPDRSIYFPTDILDPGLAASYKDPKLSAPFKMTIQQDGGMLAFKTDGSAGYAIPETLQFGIAEITARVTCSVSGSARYFNGAGWVAEASDMTVQPGAAIDVPACAGGSDYFVSIIKVTTICELNLQIANSYYATALRLRFDPPAVSTTPTEFKTTTQYNEENNVVITRSPKIGSAAVDMSAGFASNVLGYGNGIVEDAWNWPGESNYYPLAVMIQAQALCFYAAAASVFTGTAHDKAADMALPGCGYSYYARTCIPVSGIFDFPSGLLAQANLREWYGWDDVWGSSFAPEYTQQSGAGKGSTSAAGTGGSPSGGGIPSGGGVSMAAVQEWVEEQGYATETWTGQNYVNKAGDTMSGPLTVNANVTASGFHGNLHGVWFNYVWSDTLGNHLHNGLDLASVGSSTGPVYLSGFAGLKFHTGWGLAELSQAGNFTISSSAGDTQIDLKTNNADYAATIKAAANFGAAFGVSYSVSGFQNQSLIVAGFNSNYQPVATIFSGRAGVLELNGLFRSTGDQVLSSDAALKENLKDIRIPLDALADAPAVTFDWKDKRAGRSAGSIAQYWRNLIPELVHGEEGDLSLAYGQLALVDAILLAREVRALRDELAELKRELSELKKK